MTRHLQRAVNTCADGNTLIGSQMGSSPHLTLPYHPLRPSIDDSPSPFDPSPVSISPPLFFSTSTPETQPSFAKYLSLYIRLYVSSQTRAICAQVGEHLANRSNRNEAEVKEEVDKEKQRIKPRKADFGRRRSTSSSRFPSHGFNAV